MLAGLLLYLLMPVAYYLLYFDKQHYKSRKTLLCEKNSYTNIRLSLKFV